MPRLTLLVLLLCGTLAGVASAASGPFGVSGISSTPASDCSASDGTVVVTLDAARLGASPYDLSTDGGATWAVNDATPGAGQTLAVGGLLWGNYVLAVRDANGDVVFPGYASVAGCVFDIVRHDATSRDFAIASIAGATSYTWTISQGAIATGQGTTAMTVDVSAVAPATTIDICVIPNGPSCAAPATCFRALVFGDEICGNGLDDDGDGLTDCDDPDCAKPVVNLGSDRAICAGLSASLAAVVSGGVAPYTYAWSEGGSTTASAVVSPAATTTYTLTVTDANGCVGSDNLVVSVLALPAPSVLAQADPSSCGASDGSITVGFPDEPTRTTIELSRDGGATWVSSPDNVGSFTFGGLVVGTYDLRARWSDGSCPVAASAVTLVHGATLAVDLGADRSVCAGDALTLTPVVTGGVGPITYAWSPTGWTSATRTFTPAGSMTYTLTVTQGGCTASDEVLVLVDDAAPVFDAIPLDITVECGDPEPAVPSLTARDLEDGVVAVTYNGVSACGDGAADAYEAAVASPGFTALYGQEVASDPGLAYPTTVLPLELTAIRAIDPTSERQWRVRNPNPFPVYFWYEYASAQPHHRFVAPGASELYFFSAPMPAPGSMEVFWRDQDGTLRNTTRASDATARGSNANSVCGCTKVRTWTATDACGNARVVMQRVHFEDTEEPTLSGVPGATTICWTDPTPATLPVAADVNACGVAPTVAATQSAVLAAGGDSTITRLFTATDACGNTATATQRVRRARAPVVTVATVSTTCGAADGSIDLSFGDHPGRTEIQFALDGVWATVVFDNSGTYSFDNLAAGNYALATRWGDDGSCETELGTFTVAASSSPVANAGVDRSGCPGSTHVLAGSASGGIPGYTYAWRTAGGVLVGTTSTTSVSPTVTTDYTLTVSDALGCTGTAGVRVVAIDLVAPNFAAFPATITRTCIPGVVAVPVATDNCGAVTVTSADVEQGRTCANSYDIVRTYTATDGSGNTATRTQRIRVRDTVAPTFAAGPADVTLSCGAAVPTTLPTASDNCGGAVVVTETQAPGAAGCAGAQVIRTFTATDACGNTAQKSQVITFEDVVAPVLAAVPANVTLTCGAAVPTTLPTASDACDVSVTVTETQAAGAAGCAGAQVIRTFTATDACGNTATASQVVSFEDTTAPILASVPADVTLTCGAAVPTTLPTASDACDASVTVTETQATGAAGCAGAQVIRTFTATDACGNTATASQVVSFEDTTAPILAGIPADVTMTCGAAVPTTLPTVSDACDASVTVTVTQATGAASCAGAQVIRTFIATDACGNTATASQVVSYEDTTAPILAGIPADITLTCGAAVPTTLPTATDACDASVTVSETQAAGAAGCAGAQVIRTFTATDACGNTATASQVVSFEDTTAPVLAGVPADVTLTCGAAVPTTLPMASDACDASVTVSETQAAGAAGCAGAQVIRTFTASDACGNTATASQVVSFEDTTVPILAGIPADVTLTCGAAVPTTLPTASDACDASVTVSETQATGAAGCAGAQVIRTFTATDACGNTATASQVVSFEDTTVPVLAAIPADVTLTCGAAVPTTLPTASDACDASVTVTVTQATGAAGCAGAQVIRTFTATDACGNTATASQVVSFEDTTAPVLAGIPTDVTLTCGAAVPTSLPTATDACDASVTVTETQAAGAAGCAGAQVIRTFTATDACGNTATASQIVSFEDTTGPVLAGIPVDVTLTCGAAVPTTLPTASDACDASVTVSETQTTGAAGCAGAQVIRTFTATDACGNTATASQVVFFEDTTAPILAGIPADVTLTCGAAVPTSLPTVTDACDASVSVTVTQATGAASCAGAQVIRTFTATDACGNTATASQVVSFEDTTAPILTGVPADVTLTCGAAVPTTLPTASDACDASVTVTVTQATGAAGCAGAQEIRTFTATDACGNTATASQVVSFEDTTAPVLAGIPVDVTLTCGAAVPTTLPTASDACDASVTVTETQAIGAAGCAGAQVIRTFTATDACGNTATASQVVFFEDTTAPILAGIPADVTLTCGAAVPTSLPTVTDACDASVSVTVTQATGAASCAGAQVIRTFTATDACGNTATASQVVSFEDTTAPILTGVPADVTLTCGAAVPTTLPTASDACDASVTVTVTQATGAAGCAGAQEIRTFTATDACGNTATASQVVSFEDTTAPVLAGIPVDVTLTCGAAVPTTLPTASDACDASVTVTETQAIGAAGCAGAQVIRTFTATDACGNTATASQVVSFEDTTAPILASVPADVTLTCGAPVPTTLPTASDACDASVTITVTQAAGAAGCAGAQVIRTFTATDACGNTATASQVVNFEDTTAPILAGIPADVTLTCGAAVPTTLPTASDACDATVTVTVTQAPGAAGCAGSQVIRTFTATDACGNTATASQVVSFEDTTAPVLAGVPSDITLTCGAAVPTTLPTATDACDASVTVTVTQATGAAGCAGAHVIRTFTATDACGNTATASQVVSFEDTTAPILASVPADVTLTCGAAVPTTLPTASDACDASVTVTVTQAPGAAGCAGAQVIRTFTATDACGNTATASQVVSFEDTTVPVLAAIPADVTLTCGAAVPTTLPTATDACDASVTVTVTQVAGAAGCAGAQVIRTFTATDACGNTATASQVVSFEDTTAPILASVPADVTLTCGAAVPTTLPTASDACDASVTVTVTQATGAAGCAGAQVIRKFTATDACGNTATASQVVSFEDTTVPVLAGIPVDVTLTCGAAVPTTLPTASDACDASVTVIETQAVGAAGCAGAQVIRTFTATDACGNTATASQVVSFEDTTAPLLAGIPVNITLTCGAAVPTTLPTASDACDASVTVTEIQAAGAAGCAGAQVIRTFTATDACGNTATASQVVSFEDTTAPVLAGIPVNVTLTCGAAVPTTLPTANDACDASVTVTETQAAGAAGCAGTQVIRTFTATDACGNTATASQVVSFEDTTAPILAGVPADVTLTCGAAVPTTLPTASDACDASVTVTETQAAGAAGCAGSQVIRTFTATDACGNTATASQLVSFEDTTAPILAGIPANVTLTCGSAVPTTLPTASDACDASVTVTESQAAGAAGCAGAQVIRTFSATDACGNTATASQVVSFEDTTAPVLADIPANVTLTCGAAVPTTLPTASDACDASVTVTVTQAAGAAGCAGAQVIRTFTATDACGNTATASQVVSFEDTTAPVLAGVPSDITLTCGAAVPTTLPTATDACDASVTVTVTQATGAAGCAGAQVIRTFTATDACGNTATASQVVSFEDTTAPVLAGIPVDVTLTCGAAVPTTLPTASDACDASVTVTVTQAAGAAGCAGAQVIRTFTATDACGNTATASQVVSYEDTTAPILAGVPADVTLNCGAAVPTTLPTATDACDASVTVTETQTTGAAGCAGSQVIRTFTATDVCGNTATASQVVSFEDTTAPALAGVPADVTLTCGAAVPTTLPTATDACDASVTVIETQAAGAAGCAGAQVIRTFTATDACGNTATASQVVSYEDTTAPILAGVPADVTLNCGAAVPTTLPTATDACDASVTVTVTQVAGAAGCAGAQVIRTFTATDACGNTATASQVVSFEDTTAPILAGIPADVTLTCGAAVPTSLPTATDACDASVTVTETQTTGAAGCAGSQVIRTFTATDVCGNTATASQVVSFEDTTAPALAGVPADVTLTCGAAVPTTLPTATDACDASVTVIETQAAGAAGCAGAQVIRTFTATDACGNTATASQVVSYEDTTAPILAGVPADVTLNCGAAVPTTLPAATDACDASVTVNVTQVAGAAGCAGAQVIRTFTATDACGNTATASQVVSFEDTTAPILAAIPVDVTLTCGAAVPTTLPTASDACDATVTVTVTQAPGAAGCAGAQVIRTFTATDACGNTATASQVVSFEDTTAPVLAAIPADVTLTCGAAVPTTLPTATDACDVSVTVTETQAAGAAGCAGAQVIRTFTATDACGNAATASQLVSFEDTTAPILAGVPADVTLTCGAAVPTTLPTASDACDATVTVTVTQAPGAAGCAGTQVIRTFTATDACGNTATASQVVSFEDTTAPILAGVPADVMLTCGAAVPTTLPTASDACDASVTVTVTQVTGAAGCAGAQVIRTFTATDACGNTATASQTVTFEDTAAPVLSGVPAETTVACGTSLPTSAPQVTDACGAAVLTVADQRIDGPCSSSYVVVRTFTATDACGNTATATQRINVTDSALPNLAGVPAEITIACTDALPTTLPSAGDACGAAGAVRVSDRRIDGPCANAYTIVRTFSATDDCGNEATATQQIHVVDRVAPVMTEVPADVQLACSVALPTALPRATDNCQTPVAVVETRETIPGACTDSYIHVRVFTATDACGNRAVARQRVTYFDDKKPVFAQAPADFQADCGTVVPVPTLLATDDCDREVTVTFSESRDSQVSGCAGLGSLVRVWTATDNCGNSATVSQRITFVDREAPRVQRLTRAVTANCYEAIPHVPPVVSDNCDLDLTITYKDAIIEQPCGTTIHRTWIATDDCGNSATAFQSILQIDDRAPEIINAPAPAITIGCGQPLPEVQLVARDDCDDDLVYAEEVLQTGVGACPGERTLTRYFSATDACGNQALAIQVVTVIDRAAPGFVNVPVSGEVACTTYDYSAQQPTITDACSSDFEVEEAVAKTTETRDGRLVEIVTRTWTATDACGNSSTAQQRLVIAPGAAKIVAKTDDGALAGSKACGGDRITLTAPLGASNYRWSTGSTAATIVVTADITRDYSVTYGTGTACAGTAQLTIEVAPRPRFVALPTATFCEGQTVPLVVDTDIATEVTWTGPYGFTATGRHGSIEEAAVMQSGTYVVRAIAPSGCALVDSVEVTIGLGACAEICGNGLDDDGDGLVDCADPDCPCCALERVTLRTECRDRGTPRLDDDTYAVYATLHGNGVDGRAFGVSGDATHEAVYAGGEVLLGVYPIAKPHARFSFVSVEDATCSLRDQQIESPGYCATTCALMVDKIETSECVDGQHTARVTVTYVNAGGTLVINGKRFTLDGRSGTRTFSLERLSCTGRAAQPVRVWVEGLGDCETTARYDVPCGDGVCLPLEIDLGARP